MLEIVTPAATSDLTTLATAKRELGVMDTAQDARIADLIRQASDLVAQWCNRSGFGREMLRQTARLVSPVDVIVLHRDLGVTITAVTEDGVALAAADYERGGVLLYRLREGARAPWTARLVVVEYQAGFVLPDDAPPALERACLDLLAGLCHGQGRDPAVRNETTEGVGAVGYFEHRGDTLPLPPDRLAALERYRRFHL
ncbi:head-tail connector protein [Neoroseomonas soli]|uniref:Phage head-tail connector protein n=1 Tax=Neoroseomonas soli TaxID=1081025 RepID=A0A9X9WS33_9PROT|nr:phage head-tail connector protein [Neoroseomonas soli]MBR0669962.1 phage head-tail connector protein [Neoroseomonas soli]